MKTQKCLLVFIALTFILSACGPTATPSPNTKIEITNISESKVVTNQITQSKVFNQCASASSLKAEIQFGENNSKSSQKELMLGIGVTGGADISGAAKVEITGKVEQRFAESEAYEKNYQEGLDIDIPAHTQQAYTLTWQETRQEGTIEYLENGEKKTTTYSYRIGLTLTSSSVADIDCSITPTPPPAPTEIPTAAPSLPPAQPTDAPPAPPTATPPPGNLAGGCISSGQWTVDSTDAAALQSINTDADSCRALGALGLSAGKSGPLKIELIAKKNSLASGIYTPITEKSVIQFNIHVDSMYIVYADQPAVLTFAIAPANDPMTARNTARFKLSVEKNDQKPLIFFMLADVGEHTGSKVPNQHYEYGHTYAIRMELSGGAMRVYINGVDMKESLSIPTGPKVFYLGYNLPTLAGVDAEITDVRIDGVLR